MKLIDPSPVIENGHFLACHVDVMKDGERLRFCTADVRTGKGVTEVFGEDGEPVRNAENTAYLEQGYDFDCLRLHRDAPETVRKLFIAFADYFKDSPVRFEA